jgi:replicative DNA helicase
MVVEQRTRTVDSAGKSETRSKAKSNLVIDRKMPESLAAEAAVLGSMIINPVCIGHVIEQIDRNAFYRVEHQLIFDALIVLYEKHRSEAIDAVLLRDELEKHKQLDAVGGVEYLGKIMDTVPSAANVMYYAGIIKDKMLLRETITVASEILDEAFDESGETDEKLDEAERKIFAIT